MAAETDNDPLLEANLRDQETENTSLSYQSEKYVKKNSPFSSTADAYESLDYDPMENFVYQNETVGKTTRVFRRDNILRWIAVILIGVCTAVTGFAVNYGINFVAGVKFSLVRNILIKCGDCFALPFMTYLCSNVLLVAFAAGLTTLEPMSGGSGIPEVKSYLNGVRIQRLLRLRTLLVKVVGQVCSVGSGLPYGQEGPMVHVGAIIAAGISQGNSVSIPFLRKSTLFSSLRNDNDKRDFVSSGAAAGLAAAFGAPVGGVLFSLEEGSSFWNQSLTLRTLVCAMTCSFVLNILMSGLVLGHWGNLSESGLATLGSFTAQGNPGYTLREMPFFLIIGACGGLMGALFVKLNQRLAMLRKQYIKSSWGKMTEAVFFSMIVSSFSFGLSYFARDCVDITPNCGNGAVRNGIGLSGMMMARTPSFTNNSSIPMMPFVMKQLDDTTVLPTLPPSGKGCVQQLDTDDFNYFCPAGQQNNMAQIFFTSAEKAIRNLFHSEHTYSVKTLGIFFIVYFCLMTAGIGIATPGGLFVPSLLAGCAFGRLCGTLLQMLLPESFKIDAGVFALIGAASFLGGITRMTISLTIVLVESTNDIQYGLPIMMTLMVCKWVGDYFTHGIYDVQIELKSIPVLEWEPPIVMRKFKAMNVMSKPVLCLNRIDKVSRVVQYLRETRHNGFPIVDGENHFMGIILRYQLITLLKNRAFKKDSGTQLLRPDAFQQFYPNYPSIESVEIKAADMDEKFDFAPYMNLPFTIRDLSPLARVFRLFRTMGLRHLVVVDVGAHVVGIITRKDLTHLEDRLIEQRRVTRGRHRLDSTGSHGHTLINFMRPRLSGDSAQLQSLVASSGDLSVDGGANDGEMVAMSINQ